MNLLFVKQIVYFQAKNLSEITLIQRLIQKFIKEQTRDFK